MYLQQTCIVQHLRHLNNDTQLVFWNFQPVIECLSTVKQQSNHKVQIRCAQTVRTSAKAAAVLRISTVVPSCESVYIMYHGISGNVQESGKHQNLITTTRSTLVHASVHLVSDSKPVWVSQ